MPLTDLARPVFTVELLALLWALTALGLAVLLCWYAPPLWHRWQDYRQWRRIRATLHGSERRAP